MNKRSTHPAPIANPANPPPPHTLLLHVMFTRFRPDNTISDRSLYSTRKYTCQYSYFFRALVERKAFPPYDKDTWIPLRSLIRK